MFILHIGTHKTGTTSFQAYCHTHSAWLSEQGILYPDAGVHQFGHHGIPWMFTKPRRAAKQAHECRKITERLNDLAGKAHQRDILLSSEEFEYMGRPHILKLRKLLGGAPCRIILYLRRQDEYLVANYKQHVCQYETQSTDSLLEFYIRHDMGRHLDYHALYTRWAGVFGPGNVSVRLYDRGLLTGGDIVDDMLSTIGMPDEIRAARPASLGNHNESLSDLATLFLRQLNMQSGKSPREHREHIAAAATQAAGVDTIPPSRLLPLRTAMIIWQKAKKSNSKLARQLGISEPALFPPPDSGHDAERAPPLPGGIA